MRAQILSCICKLTGVPYQNNKPPIKEILASGGETLFIIEALSFWQIPCVGLPYCVLGILAGL